MTDEEKKALLAECIEDVKRNEQRLIMLRNEGEATALEKAAPALWTDRLDDSRSPLQHGP